MSIAPQAESTLVNLPPTSVIPNAGSNQPVSFISLLRGENDSTSEILRSDYQMVRSGPGLGPAASKRQPTVNSETCRNKTEAQSNKFSPSPGYRKSLQECMSDRESPSKKIRPDPDLVRLPASLEDRNSYLGKTLKGDNGVVDSSLRWASVLTGRQRSTSPENNKPWTGSILERQLRKGIESVSVSHVSSSTPSESGNKHSFNIGMQSSDTQRTNHRVNESAVGSSSVHVAEIGRTEDYRRKLDQTSRFTPFGNETNGPGMSIAVISRPEVSRADIDRMDRNDENLRRLLSASTPECMTCKNRTSGTGNNDSSSSVPESETPKRAHLK